METLTTPQLQNQHQHFSLFIKAFVEKFKPEQIYCFGKNTSVDARANCFAGKRVETLYHYFLLVVNESATRIEHEMQQYASMIFTSGTITILAHGKQTIAEALTANNRFFNTVCSNAQLIYSRDGILQQPTVPSFIPTQAGVKALKHFNHRMEMVDGFLAGADECLNEDQFNVCVFLLHQAVEQVCIALIRIHLAYRTDIHNLRRLLHLCSCFSDVPAKMFFQSGIENDVRLFNMLIESYSAARYNDKFTVDASDAHALMKKVMEFVPVAKAMCKQKIAELDQQAESYRQLKKESEVYHD